MKSYRKKISEDLDIENISDSELDKILGQVARNLTYNYLLFGKDITYDIFIENLKIHLDIIDRIGE